MRGRQAFSLRQPPYPAERYGILEVSIARSDTAPGVGDVERLLTDIGLVSARVQVADGTSTDVPNVELIEQAVAISH